MRRNIWIAACAVFVTSQAFAQNTPSTRTLSAEINSHASSSFADLLDQWENHYGSAAVNPLISIASSAHYTDRQRYIAIMGAARLGGREVAPRFVSLLKDHVWLIRSAALKALAVLKDERTASSVLPLLQDRALVVRTQAVETTEALRPPGAAQALVRTLNDRENYHLGKALWVPQQALRALASLKDDSVVDQLRPLLDHTNDPDLQRETVSALEHLTGIEADHDLSLRAQVATVKQSLIKRAVASRR